MVVANFFFPRRDIHLSSYNDYQPTASPQKSHYKAKTHEHRCTFTVTNLDRKDKGCISLTKSKIRFLNPKESEKGIY